MMKRFLHICFLLSAWHAATGQVAVMPAANASKKLAFVSDTQAPLWIESMFSGRASNRKATRMIFDNLLQVRPAAVILLGDVVSLGYSRRSWTLMDEYLDKFKAKGVTVTAALGNHELMGRPKKGTRRFKAHFPRYVQTGYVEVIDSVAVVILNSNFKSMKQATNEAQVRWYRQRLQELDADPSIVYIIVGCHHSPYSNSKRVGSSQGVQQRFVPGFLAAKKSRLFLSGHSHNFEHYQRGGKDFLVIGGGGGPHQPLRGGPSSLEDLARDYKPTFHYLLVERKGKKLSVRSQALNKEASGFEEGRLLDLDQ